MLNRFIGIGRLTRDPEGKTIPNGTAVTTFTIAIDRNFASNNGEKETDFISIVTWRGLAETCAKYLSKGKLVSVVGRLQMRNYEANDGSKRTVFEVVADEVQFLSPKSEGDAPKATAAPMPEMAPPDEILF